MLAERQAKLGSVLCVGLDPLPKKIPNKPFAYREDIRIAEWMKWVVDETAPYTSIYKPQRAHWEALLNGENQLRMVVNHIHENYPDIVVFLDCKRGDIDRTQERYRDTHFEIDLVDGMNFSPYMGKDTMEALVNKENLGRALVGLCYTSNPKARETQDVILANGERYWEFMAKTILRWSQELRVTENAGLVMAAAYDYPKGSGEVYSTHLRRCREIVEDLLWFLIPGVGTQGGFVQETIKAGFVGWGSIVISSSSGIIFAENPHKEAEKLHEEMKYLFQNDPQFGIYFQ